jgi:acid phosphatase
MRQVHLPCVLSAVLRQWPPFEKPRPTAMLFARTLLASALLLTLSACAATFEPRAHATREGEAASGPAAQATRRLRMRRPQRRLHAMARCRTTTSMPVAWMQTSVEFRLVSGQTFRTALAQLDKAIKDAGLGRAARRRARKSATGLPPAIIVDVDETMLDNTPYQARLIRDNKSFDDFSWNQWVQQRAATAMPGALGSPRPCRPAREVTDLIHLNRTADQARRDQSTTLRKAGFPIKVRQASFSAWGTVVDGLRFGRLDKRLPRPPGRGRRHRVLMQFGDQLGDFVRQSSPTLPQGASRAVRPYLGWIGDRWFVLPNPPTAAGDRPCSTTTGRCRKASVAPRTAGRAALLELRGR